MFGRKKVKEYKYKCKKCGHMWYISENDIMKDNAVRWGGLLSTMSGQWGGAVIANETKSVFKCPVCNSEDIKKIRG